MAAHRTPATGRNVPRVVRERRWWLLFLLAWAAIVGGSLHSQIAQIRQQTSAVALEGARNMFRMVVLTRRWNARHGGVYVPADARTPPNPYLDPPRRDLVTTDGLALTLVNPAYMTRLIGQMAKDSAGATFRLTSLLPVRPDNAPDDWERQALQAFEQGRSEISGIEHGPEGARLRYMAPLPVEESCLDCHRQHGYRVGDVRGGISVSQDYAPIATAIRQGTRKAAFVHAGVFALVAVAGVLLLETLRRRWLELDSKLEELEATQGQLLESEKMAAVGQLAAGIAHEINNPIGFVTANLGSLARYSERMLALLRRCRSGEAREADFAAADFAYLEEDLADLLRESREGLQRVARIVDDLKSFAEPARTSWQAADLNAGIEHTLGTLAPILAGKADIVRELAPLPPVPCLAPQIRQVVMQLLLNALQALDRRGTITVRTGHDTGWAWIEIADDGHGIAPPHLPRIFEPFYTTRPVGHGIGLGLSMAYDIVRKHGGRIAVDSPPGQGACFRVWLPLQTADAAPTPSPPPPGAS